ncbi:hypothetical protein L210DRAFT_3521553 [Boletus edulis BED1]|uniref:Response regulatory domain-containing protein n=1 Tax=Boletus edulis BED1 TaxID=1328754 RepID=A0AAD4C8K9_BOLED|nr:hypothetical protein L210DRAFT_3521553 [Boletus edulis BED1]
MTGTKQVFAPRHPLPHDDPALSSDFVGSSKFVVTWPAEPSPPIQSPLGYPVERSAVFSSSEADSDLSEREHSSFDKLSQAELSDEYDISHNHRKCFQQQSGTANTHDGCSDIPRPSRTFPAPLPSQLEHLQNPHRTQTTLPFSTGVPVTPSSLDGSRFHEFSLELADSVEMVVQTLLQISPTQILDPAKEQYAACSLSVPTCSMSAVLTTMKNLNFVSANMPELCAQNGRTITPAEIDPPVSSHATRTPITHSDFDVGEMLQGVGDALSGCAAQRGVDLVLFHADVGLRHVAVRGEEFGVSNTLTHVIRQVLHTARPGDAIDVELSIQPVLDGSSDSPIETESRRVQHRRGSYMSIIEDGHVRCAFHINHYFTQSGTSNDMHPPDVTDSSSPRPRPNFGSPLLQRLCSRTGASFTCDLPARESLPGRVCELVFPLEAGSPAVINARTTPILEYSSPLLSGARITKEPTLEELVQFSETLRGKRATLYAKESSAFAHHLTSYLTTWGMDVSHVSPDSDADGHQSVEKVSSSDNNPPSTKSRHWSFAENVPHESSSTASNGTFRPASSGTFIFIDDDVSVLRERIQKDRAEQQPLPPPVHSRGKRPSLAAHHRPKSSPQIARALGYGSSTGAQATTTHVILHFTSLANYKAVKDIVQTELAHSVDAFAKPRLDVMIIPKPAGPRRFLTALHTAVTKPIVDPLFAPIASAPTSPGIHGSPFFNQGQTTPKSPPSRPVYSPRATSDRAVKSPREIIGEPHALHPPSPLAISDTAEYFSDGSVKLGMSPASGLVISSPDGQPAGIVFQPRAKGTKMPGMPGCIEVPKGQFLVPTPDRVRRPTSRRHSSSEDKSPASFSALHAQGPSTPVPQRQDSPPNSDVLPPASVTKAKVRKPSVLADDVGPPLASSWKGNAVDVRKTSSPPGSPKTPDQPTNTFTRRPSRRVQDQKPSIPSAVPTKAGKGMTDTNIIPPISVLIVDDNPINQTILSTFMRKKKIKYDVAKNGEEAVQKWRSGGFHLILMDIQMPVMDGIQATKEIRQLESAAYILSTPQSDSGARTPSEGAVSESRTSTSTSSSPYRSSVIIVALTASSLQSDRVAALAAGCNDFLTKPVSLQWLNNKIIEWGSIKALQMWADLRPEAAKSISKEQNTQAQVVARRLHVPEGRATPMIHSPSRSSSVGKTESHYEGVPLIVSSSMLPPSEKLDALLKLSENLSTSSTNTANKHEGATTSSPVVEAPTITDILDKRSRSVEGLDSERSGITAGDGRNPPDETPLNPSGGHNEPDELP